MSRVAVASRDDEVAAAAAYFAALKPRSFLRVVETAQVPRTRVTAWIVALLPAGGTEPIGQRIVEVPEDLERFELRDGRATFLAYVPPGSITRGKDLVSTGGEGKTLACALCHGTDLKGVGLVPGIAGRSPSYVVRQLHDFRVAARAGPGAEQMKPVVDGLGDGDLLSIAAFLATLEP